jgi:hypothetical protein
MDMCLILGFTEETNENDKVNVNRLTGHAGAMMVCDLWNVQFQVQEHSQDDR